ncbi:hypothetical protein NPIL_545361 [Nephila pilipes]|uniref:Uncharacterized protein n=1 Tax=Nephila pilipes TaxID=299642 RepID=A0A8X6UIZ8_NEPPI|nr:hypothetical protein NPIL_545361 [Nephila pilipes]
MMSIPTHVPKWNVEYSHLCLTAVLHGHSQVYRTRVTSRSKNVSVVAKRAGTKSKGGNKSVLSCRSCASRPGLCFSSVVSVNERVLCGTAVGALYGTVWCANGCKKPQAMVSKRRSLLTVNFLKNVFRHFV